MIFRSSGAGNLMVGTIGLTDNLLDKLNELQERNNGNGKPLTENMQNQLAELIDKNKNPQFGKTALSFIKQSCVSYHTKRTKQIKSKYLDKGTKVENDAIKMLSEIDNEWYKKNDIRKSNDFFTGECDINHNGKIIDIKANWDIFTFYEAELTDLYYCQLQVYMELYSCKKAELVYCLMDLPDNLFNYELTKIENKYINSSIEFEENKVKEINQLILNSFYSKEKLSEYGMEKYAIKDCVRRFDVEYDETYMTELKRRVKVAQKYANDYIKSLGK